jgi:hypothetical protein
MPELYGGADVATDTYLLLLPQWKLMASLHALAAQDCYWPDHEPSTAALADAIGI